MANPNRPSAPAQQSPQQQAKLGAITPTPHNPPSAPQGQPVPAVQPPVRVEVNAPQASQPNAPQQAAPAKTQAQPAAQQQNPNAQTRGLPGDGPTTRRDAGGQTPENPTPAAATPTNPGQSGGQAPAGR